MTEISIVSGTYNRLQYVQGMVGSVRRSVGTIPYEIVLVDGGSTDGTLEWCKSQSDIVLVEQGELLGAVAAFNAGFAQAIGRYVVAANDDIEFVGDSLVAAYSFMQDNTNVGCGCFWQDRGGRDWHIEYMPAVLDGVQVNHMYGQVAIYPKWLGDMVGWWGDYLHTYGGDNELSCHILEMGYKVLPVPCACIHDMRVEDELRQHNMDIYHDPAHAARAGRPHNDSVTWGRKWQRANGQCGAIIKHEPVVPNPLERYRRILYMPIYESGHPVQRQSKRGLRDSLASVGTVYEYDYMGMKAERGLDYCIDFTFDIASVFRPDLLVFQVQGTGEYNADIIKELRSEYPDSVFVNWNGDYHPDVLFNTDYVEMLKYFHVTGLVTTVVSEEYAKHGIAWFYWQIGYEETSADPLPNTPCHDVVFLANGYSKFRHDLARRLRSMNGVDVGLYGSWPSEFRPDGSNLYDFDSGCRLYRAARFALSDNQWSGATGFVSNRLFQAMSAGGAMFLQQHFDGLELLGLVDREHLAVWHTFDDLVELVNYYSSRENERTAIAARGNAYVLENHSFDVRVIELFEQLRLRGIVV